MRLSTCRMGSGMTGKRLGYRRFAAHRNRGLLRALGAFGIALCARGAGRRRFGAVLSRRSPGVRFKVHAGFGDFYAFGFKELFLQRGVGLADEDFAAFTDNAMPGNALSR